MGKIRVTATTLMETLVATVLIVIIFMMASMLLNSIFASSLKANLQPIYGQLQKVEYQYKNGQIDAPYFEEWESWEIEI